jgi:hypothetical protein
MQNRWRGWDRLMRESHFYTGLFLVPWMVVYALSEFFLNHNTWFTEKLQLSAQWKVFAETEFRAGAAFPQDPEEQVKAILAHLDLEGPHVMVGDPAAASMSFYRLCGTGHYRITWNRTSSRLVVEKQQPFSFYSFFNFLHFQHGYTQPYFVQWTWAVLVDVVSISTVVWVVSGIYLWARRPRTRLAGGLCMSAGILLFIGLAILLCR